MRAIARDYLSHSSIHPPPPRLVAIPFHSHSVQTPAGGFSSPERLVRKPWQHEGGGVDLRAVVAQQAPLGALRRPTPECRGEGSRLGCALRRSQLRVGILRAQHEADGSRGVGRNHARRVCDGAACEHLAELLVELLDDVQVLGSVGQGGRVAMADVAMRRVSHGATRRERRACVSLPQLPHLPHRSRAWSIPTSFVRERGGVNSPAIWTRLACSISHRARGLCG